MLSLSKYLSSDEKIVFQCRTSRFAFFKEYTLVAFVVLISATSLFTTLVSRIEKYNVLASITIIIFYMFLMLSIIFLARVEFKIWSKIYALTNKRVIISEGIFSEKFESTTYDKITDMGFTQSFMDKILNIGTISIDTAGTDQIEITFENVSNPLFIKNKISDMQTPAPIPQPETEATPPAVKTRKSTRKKN